MNSECASFFAICITNIIKGDRIGKKRSVVLEGRERLGWEEGLIAKVKSSLVYLRMKVI